MAKLRLKQFDNVLTGSLDVSGSLGVSGSTLTVDGKGSVSGSSISSGSFGSVKATVFETPGVVDTIAHTELARLHHATAAMVSIKSTAMDSNTNAVSRLKFESNVSNSDTYFHLAKGSFRFVNSNTNPVQELALGSAVGYNITHGTNLQWMMDTSGNVTNYQNLTVGENLNVSGNISGSVTSTGSFSRVEVAGGSSKVNIDTNIQVPGGAVANPSYAFSDDNCWN